MARLFLILFFAGFSSIALAELKLMDPAPHFTSKTHEGKNFDLNSRKGKWTVLYFYPKADTPGCTKQACAFRDSINVIRELGGDVFGISADSVKDQAQFHKKHKLNFTLLADKDLHIIKKFGVQRKGVNISDRTTFLLGPQLKICHVELDVDPVKDAGMMAEKIKELSKGKLCKGSRAARH